MINCFRDMLDQTDGRVFNFQEDPVDIWGKICRKEMRRALIRVRLSQQPVWYEEGFISLPI